MSYCACLTVLTSVVNLNPEYKANRSKSRLPIILRQVKKWIIDELGGVMWANLEADDVISILATDKGWMKKLL